MVDDPHIQIADTGMVVPLRPAVTTIGRGSHVDVQLTDPSVSVLHAEIVRHGPYAYVADLGLSHNGTRVNGRLVGRRVLHDGDVLSFGMARCKVSGIAAEDLAGDVELARSGAPELTRREVDVVTSLCRPAMSDAAFVTPATAREIAADLVVTEAAVKQHLLRLYAKLRIPEGQNRRIRLANEVIALGLVHPLPHDPLPHDPLPHDQAGHQSGPPGDRGGGAERTSESDRQPLPVPPQSRTGHGGTSRGTAGQGGPAQGAAASRFTSRTSAQ